MKLDQIVTSLFPHGSNVRNNGGVLTGFGKLASGEVMLVIGISGRIPVGIDEAIALSGHVLAALETGSGPILVLVDSDSQRMSKRDELLGLNEFIAHLAKTLIYADLHGRPTIGLLYGHTAAGAFLGTALATRVLISLPTGDPAVMDLPSMSKVTKLPIAVLEQKAKSTPVFAPGLANLVQTGAVYETWDESIPLHEQLASLLDELPDAHDARDALGKRRGGRLQAAEIAERVRAAALQSR